MLDMAEGIAEDDKMPIEPVLLQAREVGAALVDEAIERGADCSSSACRTASGSAATSRSGGRSRTSSRTRRAR